MSEIRLSGNPILEEAGEVGGRLTCIARMGSLHILNGSKVREQERQDAEIKYLMEIEAAKKEKGDEELALHPRYCRLFEMYGTLATSKAPAKESTLVRRHPFET